ncbi:MAG: endonuclease III [Negativicoccus succinicivorans]|uniref:Endonuclease III n=1 Tax=Negativicoccus succinicivorans DORA_17_25 TaxID=1403945 RepID=W1U376_9FIRM|nr:endonuclease III [Negativicoccus succinicivorans]ETI88136.1 MAG: Endonuclease III [Negativicoccus succinicivorans DORA_17_25]MBS5917792.1 endonuclease III [Negativicoccus succinicivorans]MDU4559049.1 endonuclease III [Negativicoccus succinicivorans]MDU4576574.1 endonuclease III [Negativicoccus succinicivorans]MDU5396215.1 endonuclease III [Negativicoccus succinicivorans]
MRVTKAIREEQLAILEATYKDRKTALHYSSSFELLVAVVLSAQCTDERVNKITARIFPRLNTPAKMGKLTQAELEEEIRDCGLFRSKAQHLLATCTRLLEEYHGEVPRTKKELMTLPGVGQKTANVLVSVLYDEPAIAVDTHVFRVANRLGLARGKDVTIVERKLERNIPREKWSQAHHWLIWHGRLVCKARRPLCASCPLRHVCPIGVRQEPADSV